MENNRTIRQSETQIKIGLKENRLQFLLLVVINLFVGSMVGLERTVLPLLGEQTFGLESATAALSFIISFGFTKAIVNYFAGQIADAIGRKKVLIIGWSIGLLVPILVIFATSWWWIVFANVLLGINQGLAWSMTVNMKIDLVKSNQRGLAIGLNEFAGYSGLALAAVVSGYIASTYALRPEPFYLGFVLAVIGFVLSFLVKDTKNHLNVQTRQKAQIVKREEINRSEIFRKVTWKDSTLSSCSFAGLSTNLKDGMAWGLFPILFTNRHLSISEIGVIVALYPASWGFFQIATGLLSDRFGRKWFISIGMWTQAIAIWWILFSSSYPFWLAGAVILGLGTAMVYPTLQAAISDVSHPEWRASAMGVYRFWRDSGYAFGALLAGLLADLFDLSWAIGIIAILPFLAGILAAFRMKETLKMEGEKLPLKG